MRKESEELRLKWLIRLFLIDQGKDKTFTRRFFEIKSTGSYCPNATFIKFLNCLIEKNILVEYSTFKAHSEYRLNKKLLKTEILNNEFFKEIKSYLKNEHIFY